MDRPNKKESSSDVISTDSIEECAIIDFRRRRQIRRNLNCFTRGIDRLRDHTCGTI